MPHKPKKDPHAAREAENYAQPIASREHILNLLEAQASPLKRAEIANKLHLHEPDQTEALRRRLKAMERDGQLLRNRNNAYVLVTKSDLVRCKIIAHRDGYGFAQPLEETPEGEDYYLHAKQMKKVFHGDEVLIRPDGFDRGKLSGSIIDIVARNTEEIVGRYYQGRRGGYVVPDNPRINHDIHIAPGDENGAEQGQFVVLYLSQQPMPHTQPEGKVVEVLGDHLAPGMETEVAIRSHQIPHEWPKDVETEASKLGEEVKDSDKKDRIDLRHLPFVTIDGEDARDFDDAVYCKRNGRGWRLWVAIADVGHYVKPGSALDKEAFNRGNSVYFPQRVVPMLPEAISNGLCSLKPKVDRLTMVCEMTISERGNISGFWFYEGLIHSHARLTYNQVAAVLAGRDNENRSTMRDELGKLAKPIDDLHKLYTLLAEARDQRGAMVFETTETTLLFDREGKIARIEPVQRNDAHKMIEECMLAANVCAANFFLKHKMPALYRVHEGPKKLKLDTLRGFLAERGLILLGGDEPSPADYKAVMGMLEGRPDGGVIQTMMLRSMNQAVYEPENKGHFGLDYSAYTHFTSPIRRYPDLLVHRGIRGFIQSGAESKHVRRCDKTRSKALEKSYPYDIERLTVSGEQCSMTERRADDASRDVVAWLKCEYLSDRIGEQFKGVVSAVTSFGIFVELSDLYIEGLVHIANMGNDYFHFDVAKQRLVGERSRHVYQLGDVVEVLLHEVDLGERKIDLRLAASQSTKPNFLNDSPSKQKRKPRKRKRR